MRIRRLFILFSLLTVVSADVARADRCDFQLGGARPDDAEVTVTVLERADGEASARVAVVGTDRRPRRLARWARFPGVIDLGLVALAASAYYAQPDDHGPAAWSLLLVIAYRGVARIVRYARENGARSARAERRPSEDDVHAKSPPGNPTVAELALARANLPMIVFAPRGEVAADARQLVEAGFREVRAPAREAAIAAIAATVRRMLEFEPTDVAEELALPPPIQRLEAPPRPEVAETAAADPIPRLEAPARRFGPSMAKRSSYWSTRAELYHDETRSGSPSPPVVSTSLESYGVSGPVLPRLAENEQAPTPLPWPDPRRPDPRGRSARARSGLRSLRAVAAFVGAMVGLISGGGSWSDRRAEVISPVDGPRPQAPWVGIAAPLESAPEAPAPLTLFALSSESARPPVNPPSAVEPRPVDRPRASVKVERMVGAHARALRKKIRTLKTIVKRKTRKRF